MKKILVHVVGITTVFILLVAGGYAYTCYNHQQAAIEFWGESYNPDYTPIKAGDFRTWLLSQMTPNGGPVINAHYVSLCLDFDIGMVPIRQTENGEYEVLCGAVKSHYQIVKYTEIDDVMKEILEKSFSEKT